MHYRAIHPGKIFRENVLSILKDIKHIGKNIQNAWSNRPSALSKSDQFRAIAQQAYNRGMSLANQRKAQNAYYPGADVDRHRSDWLTKICTSTSLLRKSFSTLAARSEYAYRTDPYAKRGIDILKTFIVGSGLRPFPSVKFVGSDEPVEGLNDILAKDWERFNDQGMRVGSQQITMYEAQGIEFNTMAVLGSWLRQTVKSKPGSMLPYSFSIIKPYRLDFSHDNFYDDVFYAKMIQAGEPLTVLGQQMNKNGEPTGFWIQGEDKPRSCDFMSIHYKSLEAEQYLGIPWLTTALGHIWDLQQLFEDKMTQSRILTRMGVWEKKENKDAIASLLGTDTTDSNEQSVPFDKAMIYYADVKPEAIQFDDSIAASFGPLVRMVLHAIAVAAGCSYQLLSSDLEGANFAGGRLNLITDNKMFRGLYKHFYKCSCQTAWNKFIDWEFLTGRVPGISYGQYLKDPWYYQQCFWLPEGESWVDPLKDAQAQKLLYMTGQMTLQELCANQGKDWKSVAKQRAKEKEYLKSLGLDELLPTFSDSKTEAEVAAIIAGDNNSVDNNGGK
jgi:capsid protein